MKSHTLIVDSIRKRFDTKLLISDVYLKCVSNDIIGLLGRNGSGKSTLLRIIFGVVSAENKHIRMDGVVKNKTNSLLNEISYLHQDSFVPSHLSVKKVISMSISVEKRSSFLKDDLIQTILNKKTKHLSSGELRYLEIRLVLFNSSKFVLLDEPYNGLSPVMIEKVNELIVDNSLNKGIIITDHNYESIIHVSTQLLLMKDGGIQFITDKKELVEKGYLSLGMI